MYEFHSMICWYVPFPLKAVEYISDPIGLPRWSAPAQNVSCESKRTERPRAHVHSFARLQQPATHRAGPARLPSRRLGSAGSVKQGE